MSASAPGFSPAPLALYTSAIYPGQALFAATGGAMLAASGFSQLHWPALAFMGLALSLRLGQRMKGQKLHA